MLWTIYKRVKHLFFEQYKNQRLKKIEGIFGRNWFVGKSVLDIATAHGDMGSHFLNLGADVLFTDVRESHLESVRDSLLPMNIEPDTLILDTNKPYNLQRQFDLVLHLGNLQHIPNWKQDLECAMNHTNYMILDSMVLPEKGIKDQQQNQQLDGNPYSGVYSSIPIFTQESVEEHLTALGCKYLRFDDKELNTNWSFVKKHGKDKLGMRILYDWDYDNLGYLDNAKEVYEQKGIRYNICHQRMWLVIK